jgi:hypothetical protein
MTTGIEANVDLQLGGVAMPNRLGSDCERLPGTGETRERCGKQAAGWSIESPASPALSGLSACAVSTALSRLNWFMPTD